MPNDEQAISENDVLSHVTIRGVENSNKIMWLVIHTRWENSMPDKVGEEQHNECKWAETEVLAN